MCNFNRRLYHTNLNILIRFWAYICIGRIYEEENSLKRCFIAFEKGEEIAMEQYMIEYVE